MNDTGTLTLTEFLLARIAEDETQIRDGTAGIIALSLASRVLAECEAKRRIVREHSRDSVLATGSRRMDAQGPIFVDGDGCATCRYDTYPCETLIALGSVYADHPDYREEWGS